RPPNVPRRTLLCPPRPPRHPPPPPPPPPRLPPPPPPRPPPPRPPPRPSPAPSLAFRLASRYRPPGNSSIAPRFFNFASSLNKGFRSVFPRCSAPAISFAETASFVTCRKRNMLSGLSEEGRVISLDAPRRGASFPHGF